MRLADHVTCIGTEKVCKGVWCENLRKKDNLKVPGIDKRIILKWVFRK
jgi:hypothetical protein